eukprot:1073951-Rhodomonas_salina.1
MGRGIGNTLGRRRRHGTCGRCESLFAAPGDEGLGGQEAMAGRATIGLGTSGEETEDRGPQWRLTERGRRLDGCARGRIARGPRRGEQQEVWAGSAERTGSQSKDGAGGREGRLVG